MIDRDTVQAFIIDGVQWIRLVVELIGALVAALGVGIAFVRFGRAQLVRPPADFNAIRLVLARYLALALEFQLGADILSTAVDPKREEIIRLGAIAVIRTALNYFLGREMKEEQDEVGREREVQTRAEHPAAPTPSDNAPSRSASA